MADQPCLSEIRLALVLNELLELGYKDLDMLRSTVQKAAGVVEGARYYAEKQSIWISVDYILAMILAVGDEVYRNKFPRAALDAQRLAKKTFL